jgi:hypothetical protein
MSILRYEGKIFDKKDLDIHEIIDIIDTNIFFINNNNTFMSYNLEDKTTTKILNDILKIIVIDQTTYICLQDTECKLIIKTKEYTIRKNISYCSLYKINEKYYAILSELMLCIYCSKSHKLIEELYYNNDTIQSITEYDKKIYITSNNNLHILDIDEKERKTDNKFCLSVIDKYILILENEKLKIIDIEKKEEIFEYSAKNLLISSDILVNGDYIIANQIYGKFSLLNMRTKELKICETNCYIKQIQINKDKIYILETDGIQIWK